MRAGVAVLGAKVEVGRDGAAVPQLREPGAALAGWARCERPGPVWMEGQAAMGQGKGHLRVAGRTAGREAEWTSLFRVHWLRSASPEEGMVI